MENNIFLFIIIGFIAQIIDGSIGMAYGVTSTTFLLSTGLPPSIASSSVHMAEVFTTLVSGLSHLKFGNVDKNLFKKLVIPGVIGGVIGAYILTSISGKVIQPIVSIYLIAMGIRILLKSIKKADKKRLLKEKYLKSLGLVGGFFDAIGGGGWGPIVTTTLVSNGYNPRFTIGSVNLAEFFVTTAQTITFIIFMQFTHLNIIIGLIIGGVIAAPFSAYLCKKISPKILMMIIGSAIILLSIRTLYLSI